MSDPNLIQTKLHNQCQADGSAYSIKNNRYLYHLRFDDEIGFDWLKTQVGKVSSGVDVTVEPYELSGGCHTGQFELTVREVERRPNIDNEQAGLDSFEQ